MISAIIAKEWTEYRRDGRVVGVLLLLALLVAVGLVTGWSGLSEQQRQAQAAQRDDQATFLKQGEKNPHSAAHFGRMAYKPLPPLSVFDPGASPYLGQVIWLEAHAQDPAMFRPAEDAPDLRRLADLSVAGVLTLLVPLLLFLMGYGAFASERERGTLRQAVSSGSALQKLFAGKVFAVAVIGIGVAVLAIAVSAIMAMSAPAGVLSGDILLRSIGLILGYALYGIAFTALALLVSAKTKRATSALLVLLSLWAVSVVVLPRIAATASEHLYPTPDSGTFWSETYQTIRESRPDRDSAEYKAAERLVLSRALGREVSDEEVAAMDLNRSGLRLEVSEVIDADAFGAAYTQLYKAYQQQQEMRRIFSIFSPAILLQHVSSGLSGTDTASHRHFAMEAEKQRNVIVRKMNEDMMLNGAGESFAYLADEDFWESIPDFRYQPVSLSYALRSVLWDFLLLGLWAAVALWLAWRAARNQKII